MRRSAGSRIGSGAPLSAKPVVWPVAAGLLRNTGGVAQLGEHLLCKQGVVGSIPITSTSGESAAFTARFSGYRAPTGVCAANAERRGARRGEELGIARGGGLAARACC